MAKAGEELRETVAKLAREYMADRGGDKGGRVRTVALLLTEAGLDEEEAAAFWYEVCAEIVEKDLGIKLPEN